MRSLHQRKRRVLTWLRARRLRWWKRHNPAKYDSWRYARFEREFGAPLIWE